MPATLEPPQTTRKRRSRTPGTWTPEQARQANARSHEAKRRNYAKRKEQEQQTAQLLKSLSVPDPLTQVETALAAAAKHGKAKAVESLASALAKLKRAGVGRPEPQDPACVSYTPSNSSSPRSSHPQTPQAAQPVQYHPSTVQPDYAQYRDHLIGPTKESPFAKTVGCEYPIPPAADTPTRGVIARITRRLETMSFEELVKLEGQIQPKQRETVKSVGVEPVKSVMGAVAESGVERFCVNGVWISGKRVK